MRTSADCVPCERICAVLISLLIALVGTSTLARAEVPAAVANVPPEPLEEYGLSIGDKISVTVFGQPDLKGDYTVDGSGNINFPLAGAISVAGATTKECEQKIAASLAAGYLRNPVVGVSISELRPIYVVGDVKSPGTYPYRYGSTVLSAIAVAGGYGSVERVPGTAASDLILSDERVRVLEQTRAEYLVRQERIAAQLGGESTFDPPNPAEGTQSEKQIRAAIENEKQVFAEQALALSKEIALQEQQRPTIKAALDALVIQTEGDRKQLQLVTEQFSEYSKLDKLGLSRRVTETTIQREMAALESSIAKLDADRSRLDLLSGEINIKIQDLKNAYLRRCRTEMQEVRTKLVEIDATLPSAHELRALRAQRAGGLMTTETEDAPRTLSILRTRDNVAKTIPARGDMFLRPGDIVEVRATRTRELAIGPQVKSPVQTESSASLSLADGLALPRR
jgi:polysaccharide export outer membrane protein